MILNIPTDILNAVKFPLQEMEQEFHKELALALYQRGALSLGKSRLLAKMTRWEFEELLGERKIVRQYTVADLEEDIEYGLSYQ